MIVYCFQCKSTNSAAERVGRRDSCTQCGADLHVCYNCEFYDLSAYNECREVQAERVLDKDQANFCDFFSPRGSSLDNTEKKQATKNALEALFKKN